MDFEIVNKRQVLLVFQKKKRFISGGGPKTIGECCYTQAEEKVNRPGAFLFGTKLLSLQFLLHVST